MKETVWLMDSDFCDNCGALLGLDDCSGLCPTCFDLYIAETSEDDWFHEGIDDEDHLDIEGAPITWRNIVEWLVVWLVVLLLSIGLIVGAFVLAIEKIQAG